MNYSQSLQVLHTIDLLLERLPETEPDVLAGRIQRFLDIRVDQALAKTETADTWAATKSEWDYINTMKGILHTLNGDSELISEKLLSIRKTIESFMPPAKIAFFTQEYFVWPSFQSIWEHCQTQEDCETRLVYVYHNGPGKPLKDENYYKNTFEYRNNGYPLMEMSDFQLPNESPDIVFYMKPYYIRRACPPKFYVNEIVNHTPYTAFISYCLDVQGGKKLIQFFYALPAFYRMWKVVGYSKYYAKMMKQYGFRNGKNVVELGHPKFDFTYRALVKREFTNEEWARKINGRPVVLWNSHFSVEENGGVGTYYIWKDVIFDYFMRNKDIVLLWRPHPIFWQHIKTQPGYNHEEFTAMLNELRASDNVIVDDTSDYRYAFSMSDALISDAATFLVEYCGAGQPVLYTPKENGEFIINEDYLKGIESATSAEQIIDFLDRAKDRNESGKQERMEYFKEQFGESDGKNGQRIYEYMMAEMKKDCLARATALINGDYDILYGTISTKVDEYESLDENDIGTKGENEQAEAADINELTAEGTEHEDMTEEAN